MPYLTTPLTLALAQGFRPQSQREQMRVGMLLLVAHDRQPSSQSVCEPMGTVSVHRNLLLPDRQIRQNCGEWQL
jgi:hypothetical protein